jgi:hypothetical protein
MSTLTASQLLVLDRSADRTLAELARTEPDLYAHLDEKVAARRAQVLAEALPSASPELLDRLSALDYLRGHAGRSLADAFVDGLADVDLTPDLAHDAAVALAEFDPVTDVADPALPDLPLRQHPLFAPELRQAAVAKLALRAGLDLRRVGRVVAAAAAPGLLTDQTLDGLVADATLSDAEADALGLTATLYHLTGDSIDIAASLAAGLAGRGITTAADLSIVDEATWQTALDDQPGLTYPGGGRALERLATALQPTRALLARVTDNNAGRIHTANPDRDLLALDYTPDSPDVASLKLNGLSAKQRAGGLASLRRYQRVFALTDSVPDAVAVLKAGYPGAVQIAAGTAAEFQRRTGLPAEVALSYHDTARATLAQVTTITAGLADEIRNALDDLPVHNTPVEVDDYLRRIPGYANLFGSLDNCACSGCRSILSPAAYFVDLMSFVDEHVSGPYFVEKNRADHPLHLRTRRPDLWTLPLTCENTNTLVRELDLVNEILERYLAKRTGFAGSAAQLSDHVYRRVLARAVDSFRQPFTLPLVELTSYLAQFELERGDVTQALHRPNASVVTARLGLAQREYQLITRANTDLPFLSHIYGRQFQLNPAGNVDPVPVKALRRFTGLSREDLGALADTGFVGAGPANPIRIVSEKSGPDAVQNDVELVHGLRTTSLDRLHRLARLARVVPWSIPDLDLLLAQAGGTLTEATLAVVVDALAVHRRFALPIAVNCALWSELPSSLLDDLFAGDPPDPATVFVHPSLRAGATPLPEDSTLHRLRAALAVTDAQLGDLIRGLAPALGANLDAPNENDRGFTLTRRHLSLLYRHARLAALLSLTVPDLFALLALNSQSHVDGLPGLKSLLSFVEWQQASGYSPRDLAQITGLTPLPAPITAQDFVAQVRASGELEFADTIFAFLPGVTEADSRGIVAANGGVAGPAFELVEAPGPTAPLRPASAGVKLRLRPGFDPEALVVPAGYDRDALVAMLRRHHVATVVPARLGPLLGFAAARVEGLNQLIAATGRSAGAPEIAEAFRANGSTAALADLITALNPLTVLFRPSGYDTAALTFVRENPGLFGITTFAAIGIGSIQALSQYVQFPASGDVLLAFDPARGFAASGPDAVAAVLGTDRSLIATLLPHVPLPPQAPAALAALNVAAQLATRLGVDGDTLAQIASDDYRQLALAAAGVRAGLADAVEALDDQLAESRRDALVDYLIRSLRAEFTTAEDIYEYLLIDVSVAGCARTSPLVAALSTVQLYIQRVLLHLEQDRTSAPGAIDIRPGAIPADQWEWRKFYRYWEANRKIFLWPENYLEPALRDDKSPQFADLESALLQQEITPQNVLDAYSAYLADLDQLAGLTLAGAFHELHPGSQKDTLHLFGVTTDDPPVYYYRAVTDAHYGQALAGRHVSYGPWRQVGVTIPSRKVAALVFRKRLHLFWTQVVTNHRNSVSKGTSRFAGYRHKLAAYYTVLRLDGSWSAPQQVSLHGGIFTEFGDGVIDDPLADKAEERAEKTAKNRLRTLIHARHPHPQEIAQAESDFQQAATQTVIPRFDRVVHVEPKDGYTLRGFQWDRLYPHVSLNAVRLTGANFQMRGLVDFYRQQVVNMSLSPWLVHEPEANPLLSIQKAAHAIEADHLPVQAGWRLLTAAASTSFIIDGYAYASIVADYRRLDRLENTWGSPELARNIRQSIAYHYPLGAVAPDADLTVVAGSLTDALVDVSGDLIHLQGGIRPGSLYVATRLSSTLVEPMRRVLFTGGIAALLRLRTQQQLRETPPRMEFGPQIDHHRISSGLDFRGGLGPYFQEVFFHAPFLIANHLNATQQFEQAQHWYHYLFDPTTSDRATRRPHESDRQFARRRRDRVWRYLDFRNKHVPSLREILTDPQAIQAYLDDPFNPFAIARLRPSAYQKCIVMKYVDNLLDWGDSRFSQFTTESVGEATQLYVFASQVLGPRPEPVGECGGDNVSARTYQHISEDALAGGSEFLSELENLIWVNTGARAVYQSVPHKLGRAISRDVVRHFSERFTSRSSTVDMLDATVSRPLAWKTNAKANLRIDLGWSVVRQIGPAFCIPANPDLRGYWDRVEDRLYKIRHCQDIDGVTRQLALFAPEIDPRLLVLARAQGLSIADVVGATSGDLPPYRFTYLIDKARQHANLVQTFGTALLSALEKKDTEELSRLRIVHQQHLEQLTTKVRERELRIAEDSVTAVQRQIDSAQYRLEHFSGLLASGLNANEQAQQASRHLATAFTIASGGLAVAASTARLVAQVGSPFAIVYGGEQIGESLKYWSEALGADAHNAEVISSSAGLEAGFDRRREDWQHQLKLAQLELKQLDRQASIAEFRRAVAERSLQLHRQQLDQTQQILDFYGDKFTGIGLYTYLSSELHRLYRDAYNSALATARLAEQAFRFERGDVSTPLLRGDYFDSGKAGLLAGEKLLLDLESMDRRYLETNYRTLEVEQSFALTQVAPHALVRLRERGECTFALPELFFDLAYPGQYLRRIRAVRVSLPCVAGPYTNVPATLTLTGSQLRREPNANAALVDVPPQRSITIATSKAQNDSGVFEFSFRDERYMPFEGAGAVSSWRLTLPTTFRPFDYHSIADVVLHLSYTSDHDEHLRTAVERANGALFQQLAHEPIRRVFSLRHDFSLGYPQLLAGTASSIEITPRHLPYFLDGHTVTVGHAQLALLSPHNNPTLEINGVTAQSFTALPLLGGLPATDVTMAFTGNPVGTHTLRLTHGTVDDVLLYLELKVS